MRTVGIDIGSYSIKVAEVETLLKSVITRNFYEIELNHEPGQDNRLAKIEALRKIAAEYDPQSYRIVVGLGSEFSTQRILTFPFLERRKILQSLPFELEDVIPFSQADAIFDCRVIKQKENSSRLVAFAVPKKYISELLILCEDAGLSPDIVSLDGVALSNLFENYLGPVPEGETQEENSTAQLVIHLGYTKTLINVMQDHKLLSSRALFFGGKDLATAVSNAYSLPFLEALKGVAEKGFILTQSEGANEDQIAFSQVIHSTMKYLISDLKRAMLDLKAELQLDFTSGIVMGGMSRLINLGPYLTQELEIPINVYQHLGEATKLDILKNEETEKISAIAIGLALEGLRKPRSPALNLRKNEFSKQSQNFQILMDQYKDAFKFAAALFVIFFIYSWMRSDITESNLTAVDQVIKSQGKNSTLGLSSKQLQPENLKKFVKSKRDEIESKREVVRLNKTTSALEILKNISSVIPQKNQITLDLKNFNLEGEHLQIEGFTNNKAEADRLQRSLGQLPALSKITQDVSKTLAPAGKYPFSISMNVARVPSSTEKKKK